MELSAEALRGYLDYLRDLGINDLYRDPALSPDAAAIEALQAVLSAGSKPAVEARVQMQSQSQSQRMATPAAPAAAPSPARKVATQPLPRPASGQPLQIVVAPAKPAANVPQTVSGAPAPFDTDSGESPQLEVEAFAPPAMPLISFNQLAPLPPDRIPASEKPVALQALRAHIGDCTRCPLAYAGRHTIVFADGDPNAALMFVGEGPGADEDASGVPFVGKAGQLLNNMIGAMGLARSQVYIANVVMCRPPKNRTPEPVEANTCSQFLLQQIDLVRPRVIVALGGTAATYLLGVKQPLSALRGQWHDVRGAKCAVTYHPAFLLRDPRMKAETWKDLQRVMTELDLKPPART